MEKEKNVRKLESKLRRKDKERDQHKDEETEDLHVGKKKRQKKAL